MQLWKKNAYFLQFYCNKNFPYEFLVAFGRCGFETEKVRDGAGWDGVRGGSGQNLSNSCGWGQKI